MLQGMFLLVVSTVTADGRPLAGPVDGYLLHGSFYFSSGRDSVRMRHLAKRPAVTAVHLPGEQLAVTVHGRAELFELRDPGHSDLRQAMLDHYLPKQGPAFATWLDQTDALGARIEAEKIFTFHN
jgi:general stress protein 26